MNDTKQNTSNISNGESETTEQIPTSQDTDSDQMVRTKSSPIESVRQLIEQVFGGTLKSRKLSKSVLVRMRQESALSSEEIKELVKNTNEDRLLKYTLILLTIGLKNQIESSTVTEQIGKFVQEKLENHPAFKGTKLHYPVENVIHLIARFRKFENLRWPDEFQLNGREVKECRTNAIRCFFMWLWIMKGIPLERIQDYLLNYIWKPSVHQTKTDAEKVISLIGARDLVPLAISNEVLYSDLDDQKQRTESAELANKNSQKKAMLLENELRNVQLMLADTMKEADSLRKKLDKEYQEHANDNAHLKDDYETLRGQVLSRLKAELVLLEEGLHAIRRDRPKIDVMVDHAERAIDGLKSEYERLLKRGES